MKPVRILLNNIYNWNIGTVILHVLVLAGFLSLYHRLYQMCLEDALSVFSALPIPRLIKLVVLMAILG